MTAATDLCGGCGQNVHLGDDEFQYDRDGTVWHLACKPRKGTDAMPTKTGIAQKHAGPQGGPYFGFDLCLDPGNHPIDEKDWTVGAAHDTLYSYAKPRKCPDVVLQEWIEVTYSQNESNGKVYLNVESWREVAAPEGQPSEETVKATVTATQDKREEGIFRSVALQQAVAYCTPLGHSVAVVEDTYLHFLRMLTNPASLREPGDVTNHTDGAPKPVLDHNGPRNEEGYLIKASEAERASQDAAAPVDPADPKYVERYAPA